MSLEIQLGGRLFGPSRSKLVISTKLLQLSVTEIVYDVVFEETYSFTAAFRRFTGHSPTITDAALGERWWSDLAGTTHHQQHPNEVGVARTEQLHRLSGRPRTGPAMRP